MKRQKIYLILGLIFLIGCSGLERSEEKRIRAQNLVMMPIQRQSNETLCASPPISFKKKTPYPWENKWIGPHRRITKDFFYCQGSCSNPPIQVHREKESVHYFDCDGIETHSLPIRNGKEFIYPVLLELLNDLQHKLGKRVVITCGHRCPVHNLYSDVSIQGQCSKHLIGAEVDFYVEGLENDPQTVLKTLLSYYKKPLDQAVWLKDASTSSPSQSLSWYNNEVSITLFHRTERRDFDNAHPYPYLSIEVKYDRDTHQAVKYNWYQAHNGYIIY